MRARAAAVALAGVVILGGCGATGDTRKAASDTRSAQPTRTADTWQSKDKFCDLIVKAIEAKKAGKPMKELTHKIEAQTLALKHGPPPQLTNFANGVDGYFGDAKEYCGAQAKAAAAQPAPSPNGTFTGSCDYTLPVDIDGDYKLIGDIEARNTGNIGIKVKVTIKWLQMGYDPVTESKTVKVKPGGSKTVKFNKTVSGTVIDRVQSYQLNHMDERSCKYKGVMVDTFGKVRE